MSLRFNDRGTIRIDDPVVIGHSARPDGDLATVIMSPDVQIGDISRRRVATGCRSSQERIR
jgi:hypothetical protein